LPLARFGVDAFVVDPRCFDLDRPGTGEHLAGVVVAVADHQPVPVGVDLIGELLDIGRDFSLQRGGQHLAGAVADNLIEQRPTTRCGGVVGTIVIVNYREHRRASQPARQRRS
jgi:hypothetical protein